MDKHENKPFKSFDLLFRHCLSRTLPQKLSKQLTISILLLQNRPQTFSDPPRFTNPLRSPPHHTFRFRPSPHIHTIIEWIIRPSSELRRCLEEERLLIADLAKLTGAETIRMFAGG